jgi:uncharacterized protein YecA (UPF0149 family)
MSKKKLLIVGKDTSINTDDILIKNGENPEDVEVINIEDLKDLKSIMNNNPYKKTLDSMPEKEVMVLRNYHNYLKDPLHNGPKLDPVRTEPKTQRNELCPCGSGRKFKNCCLSKS